MTEAPQFRVNPTTLEVEEFVPQTVQEDQFQAALDTAQNRLNTANEQVTALEDAYAATVTATEAANLALESGRREVELAQEEIQFQSDRKAAYDEALRLRDTLSQSTPENEFAEDVAAGEVDIPINVAASAVV